MIVIILVAMALPLPPLLGQCLMLPRGNLTYSKQSIKGPSKHNNAAINAQLRAEPGSPAGRFRLSRQNVKAQSVELRAQIQKTKAFQQSGGCSRL